MKYDTIPSKVILTLPGTDGNKTIDLVPGADGAELTTPRRLNYVTTYAGGSATQSGVNPDIDEIFTDSQNITGRTRYVGAKIKLFYPNNTDYEFTIADQKTRTKMNVNGAEVNGYTFTTEGKTGFAMPTGLVKDSQIGITNTDVKKASTPSDKAFEKVQAKVTFDLNGGKLATTVKSFEGFDTTKLPGTEFDYKLQRASDTAPVVRIAPMNEKAAGEEGYTPNGFKVDKYIDHNGDVLKDDALELRKFVSDKPTKDGVVFYGWTTKKVTSVEEFNKLEELKTEDQAKDTVKTYKFTENSPIISEMTVYAFYGPVKSQVTNPKQTYDETKDKQYVEVTPEEGKTLPTDATYKLVKKNEDGTYTEVEGLTQTTKEDGTPVFDITDLPSDKFDPEADYYIETTETGKDPSYSDTPIKIDKVGPSFTKDKDGKNITLVQDAYGYQVKVSANASDDAGILRVYAEKDKDNGYYKADASETTANLTESIQDQLGVEKTFTVTAVDKFGNKTETTQKVEPKAKPLELKAERPLGGTDYIYVTTIAGANLEIKVIDANKQEVLAMTHTQGEDTDEIKLVKDGTPFELSKGQRIKITATSGDQTAKLTIRVR